MSDDRLRSAIAEGRIANLDHVASARHSIVHGGPGHGCRALDLRVYGGIDVRVLPDRGFDIGDAWFRGIPIAWTSAVGEQAPLSAPRGSDWLDAFGGGLVTTCGLQNVGAPSEGHGLHGVYSHQRAKSVGVERHVVDGEVVLSARAVIEEVSALGVHLRVERTITTRTQQGLLEVQDVSRNLRSQAVEAPLLYHVNVGAPVWEEPARLEIPSTAVTPRDSHAEAGIDEWDRPPRPVPGAPERVFEHTVPAADGWGRATVANPRLALRVSLDWDATTLPRLHQWVHPAPGIYALGLEPANCSVLGRAVDRAAGHLPVLSPGDERVTRLRITVATGP